ncbi:MAG TPA: phytoene desaturase family protein [Flavobacterium sp.]|nr:phytoene desaturase family protein [Flavobacterium sp.]
METLNKKMSRSVVIIGAGFAGLSSAAFLAKEGWDVTVVEKNAAAGGRASQFTEQGFTFDMGPSWYWMPDVFERFFSNFGKTVSDYYTLSRLDPSYRIYWESGKTDIPANYDALREIFEKLEPGTAKRLDNYLSEAADKYRIGMQELVYKPGLSWREFVDWQVIRNVFKLDIFSSIKKHIGKHFSNRRLQQIMEFPVLFLGALPENTPALYSLMNYADIKCGTWYPDGGMYSIVKAMKSLCDELGVKFLFNEPATQIVIMDGRAKFLKTVDSLIPADVIISSADYQFTESTLLPEYLRTYSDQYWNKKQLAPSCLIFYVGLDIKLDVQHHSLFFDVPFDAHASEIYDDPQWPTNPLFYLCAPSKTDLNVAPPGCENLFFLIPIAAGLQNDNEKRRTTYFDNIIHRLEEKTGREIRSHIIFKRSYSVSDFVSDYNSYKGNAYGLANTLMQTAILKPSCRSKKVKNLFYAGQFTVPGPGVPPALISGEVVAKEVIKHYNNQ